MSADFLSRWSRRKLEARRPAPEPEEAPPRIGEGPLPAEPSATEAAASPETLAALPRLEDLTPDSDVSAFLQKGIPATLRNAALRKMWSLDPTIRDFVGEARDYAYDWNTPGGVPGSGALAPGDDAARMVRGVFGGAKHEETTGGDDGPACEASLHRDVAAAAPGDAVAAAPQRNIADAEAPTQHADVGQPVGNVRPAIDSPPIRAVVQQEAAGDSRVDPAARRHGGAKPV
jgi:hypothetical protein